MGGHGQRTTTAASAMAGSQTQNTGDHFPIGYYEQPQVPYPGRARRRVTRSSTRTSARFWRRRGPTASISCARSPSRRHAARTRRRSTERPSKLEPRHLRPCARRWPHRRLLHVGRTDDGSVPVGKKYDDDHLPDREVLCTTPRQARCPTSRSSSPTTPTIAEFLGTSNDYHPHGSVLVGEGYVQRDPRGRERRARSGSAW